MSVATWVSFALLVAAPSTTRPDAGADTPSQTGCAVGERNDLKPGGDSFEDQNRAERPFFAAVWADLVQPAGTVPVLMVMTTSITDMPEMAVSMTRKPGAPRARVTVRQYRENLWVRLLDWLRQQPWPSPSRMVKEEWALEPAFLQTASRKLDKFEADIDDEAFAAVARVWSSMIARARPDGPSRVKVFDHVSYYLQAGERFAHSSGRSVGSLAERTTELGKMLASYSRAKAPERSTLRDQLVAAAASLQANIDRLNACERTAR